METDQTHLRYSSTPSARLKFQSPTQINVAVTPSLFSVTQRVKNAVSVLATKLTSGHYTGGFNPISDKKVLSYLRGKVDIAIREGNTHKVELMFNQFRYLSANWHLPKAIEQGNLEVVMFLTKHSSASPDVLEAALIQAKKLGKQELVDLLTTTIHAKQKTSKSPKAL